MCTLPVEHVQGCRWAYAHIHFSMCTLSVEHVHAFTFKFFCIHVTVWHCQKWFSNLNFHLKSFNRWYLNCQLTNECHILPKKYQKSPWKSVHTFFGEFFAPNAFKSVKFGISMKNHKKKVFSDLIFESRKAFKVLTKGVKRVYCSVAYLWDFRPVPRTRVRFVPRFAIPDLSELSEAKMLLATKEKNVGDFFFWRGPPLTCHFLARPP